jgi:hypothetical protein
MAFSTVQGQDSEITFTLDQLEQIGNRVWTGHPDHGRAVSERDFLEFARRECG